MNHRIKAAGIVLFLALFAAYAYFSDNNGWNQKSRLVTLHALLRTHSLVVDGYTHRSGDLALINGHYYSNKAPAVTFLALPAFSLAAAYLHMHGISIDEESGWNFSAWIAAAGSVGILTALGGAFFFALAASYSSARYAAAFSACLFLAVPVFPYAVTLFSHAATIGLLSISLWAAVNGARSPHLTYAAGLTAGAAVAGEYNAAIALAGLFVFALTRGARDAGRFCAGAFVPLALLMLFHYQLTGSLWGLPLRYDPALPEWRGGGTAHTLPSLRALYGLLFSEYRGLLFWSPMFVLALPGWAVLWKRSRALAILTFAITALTVLEQASFMAWHGGWAVGARYLAPAIPCLGLAALAGAGAFPRVGIVLALISLLAGLFTSPIGPIPPLEMPHPLWDYYLPRWHNGELIPNIGKSLGLPARYSLLPFLAIEALLASALFYILRRPSHTCRCSWAFMR